MGQSVERFFKATIVVRIPSFASAVLVSAAVGQDNRDEVVQQLGGGKSVAVPVQYTGGDFRYVFYRSRCDHIADNLDSEPKARMSDATYNHSRCSKVQTYQVPVYSCGPSASPSVWTWHKEEGFIDDAGVFR